MVKTEKKTRPNTKIDRLVSPIGKRAKINHFQRWKNNDFTEYC